MNPFVSAVLIALGGASGALARSGVDALAARLGIAAPLGTLAVNVSGSFTAGLVATLIADRVLLSDAARPLLLVGLLGGFTSYSSFAFQSVELLESGRAAAAVAYMVCTNVAGLVAVWAGLRLCR